MEIFKLVFSPIEVNTYILADKSGDCAVIDCGCYGRDEFRQLTDLISSKNLRPVLLLNTHCHLDHIFGNTYMLEEFGLGTHCHKNDEYNRRESVRHAQMFGLSMENPPEPAGLLEDGQKLSFGSIGLNVLHVPGHSAGSLAFYSSDESVVFTGDALFAGSIGRTDLYGGNYETLINSIRTRLFSLPPHTIVYPGHGRSSTIEREIATNPFFTAG